MTRLNFLCIEAEWRLKAKITLNYRRIEKIAFLHTQVSDCEICTGSNNYRQPGVSKISRTEQGIIMCCSLKLLPDLTNCSKGQHSALSSEIMIKLTQAFIHNVPFIEECIAKSCEVEKCFSET